MKSLIVAGLMLAAAGPALAQPGPDPLVSDIQRAIPRPEQVERMGPVIDRAVDALLSVDIGPILDALDPDPRNPDYGRPGRTLGRVEGRGDPRFAQRMHESVYGTTMGMARAADGLSAAAPSLARAIREIEAAIAAVDAPYYRRPRR